MGFKWGRSTRTDTKKVEKEIEVVINITAERLSISKRESLKCKIVNLQLAYSDGYSKRKVGVCTGTLPGDGVL